MAALQAGYHINIDQFKQDLLSVALMVNFPSLIPNPDPVFPQPETPVPFPLRRGQPIPLNPESPVFRPASMETDSQLMCNEEFVELPDNGSINRDEVEHDSEGQDNGAESREEKADTGSGEGKADTERTVGGEADTEASDGGSDGGVALADDEEKESVEEREETEEEALTRALYALEIDIPVWEEEEDVPDNEEKETVEEREETEEEALTRALYALEINIPEEETEEQALERALYALEIDIPVEGEEGEEEERLMEEKNDSFASVPDRRLDDAGQGWNLVERRKKRKGKKIVKGRKESGWCI
jgi:hypothetical protein